MPADLNVSLDYFLHPKTRRLVVRLGRGAEVLPLKLWTYCGKVHKQDGRLVGYSAPEIERLVEWWGKPGECVNALLEIRWLDLIDGGYQVHDWEEHQGHLWAYHLRAVKGAQKRWANVRGETTDATSNACSIHQAVNKQCSSSTNPTNPSPLPPEGVGERVGGIGRNRKRDRAMAALAELKARDASAPPTEAVA